MLKSSTALGRLLHSPPRWLSRVLALLAILALYGLARLPEPSADERAALAAAFRFVQGPLEGVPGPMRGVREVSPAFAGISAWISSVGAGVALADFDGDGLANDACLVDPRTDLVSVLPVPGLVAPGSTARFATVALDPRPLPYDRTMAPMGCLPGDFDGDGRMDALVYYWGRTPLIFLGDGRGGFRPLELAAQPARWYTNSATLADLDGDGRPDLVIANYFPDGSRLLDPASRAPETMQHSMSRAFNGGPAHFFLEAGSHAGRPAFTEVSVDLPADVRGGWTLALGAADLDGDLLPELYFANDFGPDRLLHNRSTPGALRFVPLEGRRGLFDPASKVLGRDSFKGMGIDFADLDGSGRLGMFVSNIAAEHALQESHFAFLPGGPAGLMQQGIAPYTDQSEALGLSRSDWGWDLKLADFANDGRLELVQATGFVRGSVNRWPELQELAMANDELLPDPRIWADFRPGADLSGNAHLPFFVRGADGRYVDLAADIGLGRPMISRGLAIADVDGDGDLDLAIANQWEPSLFLRNDCPRCGRSLELVLRVPLADGASRAAIGAEARVRLPDGRVRVAQVDGGNGHSGRRAPELHFGLGDSEAPVPVTLRWRAADGQVHVEERTLAPGRHVLLLDAAAPGGA